MDGDRLEKHNKRISRAVSPQGSAAAHRPIYYTHSKIPIPDGLVQEGLSSAAGAKLCQTQRGG